MLLRRVMSSYQLICLIIPRLLLFSNGVMPDTMQLTSYRVENVETIFSPSPDGQLTLYADRSIDIRIFSSQQISVQSQISFTNIVSAFGSNCSDLRKTDIYEVQSVDDRTALLKVTFSKSDAFLDGYLMFCYRADSSGNGKAQSNWIHQGNDKWMRISLMLSDDDKALAMIWVRSILVPIFLLLSALFSGLSLNLLSLTKSELKVLRNQGTSEEKRYSRAVVPLRKRGNVLFCSLLLMNTLANVVVAVLLYELIQLYSILAATLLIVFLGEIVPQTICSKYGLSFGNKMGWLTNVFFVLTLPFSYPVGKLMDVILDDEVPAVYNRDRFQEMLSRSEKSKDAPGTAAARQASGAEETKAFKLSNHTVGDIMVKLDDAYMEEYDSILNSEKVSEILQRGYTRIPVFEKDRSNVVALLHIRDLTLIDPEDQLTLKMVCKFYNRPVNFVFEDTKLTVMLEEFKKGQSHMALVQRVNNEGPGDPYYETLGMVTLEDVIEDIFHSDAVVNRQLVHNVFDPQIHFQSSTITSDLERLKFNKYTALHKKVRSDRDIRDEESLVDNLPPNLFQAVKYFLPSVPAFQSDLISSSVLGRLLKQSSVVKAQVPGANQNASSSSEGQSALGGCNNASPIVDKGRLMDFFVLVLEGKVQITIGAENLLFNEGPFTHFGHQALLNALSQQQLSLQNQQNAAGSSQSEYIPDFTVQPITEVLYLKIPQVVYLSSIQATQLQRLSQRTDSTSDISLTSPPARPLTFPDDDAFVEANNAKNAYLNFQKPLGFPSNQSYFIDATLDFATATTNPPSQSAPKPYGFQEDSWYPFPPQNLVPSMDDLSHLPLGKSETVESPCSEWMERHTKGGATKTFSKSQEAAAERSTPDEEYAANNNSCVNTDQF